MASYGVAWCIDRVDQVALKTRVEQGWHGFLLRLPVHKFPSRGRLNVWLAQKLL
ncbi:hypothetical protein [Myxacorys almedinensis]|uniref:hypothetical protein n=1 Tax=Myxacorys almedinensis TaxID=2651157 RepID=UPI001EE471DA|nr:hypothetical protein [Myxacorys almedinensis]